MLYNVIVTFISICIVVMNFQCADQTSGVETTNGATILVHAEMVDGTTPPFTFVYLFSIVVLVSRQPPVKMAIFHLMRLISIPYR